jgi:bifunctional NMN adenylyltransferase/nudix hydrolase
MTQVGVVIGRFQVPLPTAGHKLLFSHAAKHESVAILVGVAPVEGTARNPMDFMTRMRMLNQCQPKAVILPLCDVLRDSQWSRDVDAVLEAAFPYHSFTIYHGRQTGVAVYAGRHKLVEIDKIEGPSGTEARGEVMMAPPMTSDFRAGIIYACTVAERSAGRNKAHGEQ